MLGGQGIVAGAVLTMEDGELESAGKGDGPPG
jgi:hypothetical protein